MKRIIPFILRVVPRPVLIRLSYSVMHITAFAFKGNNVECPVCEGKFRKFLPYGYNQVREGVLCPRCFSLERHRLLWLFLQRCTDFFAAQHKVLHVAPEQCFYNRFRKQKNLEYTTADLESPLADVKLDIQDMPFQDNTFDIVICNHVLEHVADDKKAMKEIHRIIRPEGFAILQVPADYGMEKTHEDPAITDPHEREKHFRQKDHYRLYGIDYTERLKEAGFVVRNQNFTDQLKGDEIKRYRLPASEFMVAYYKQ
ncbi:MAG: class I SAM-dependent methyltransferase [Bacteroidales bacterium]|nr:class I SAM-dependent methyltransferase [Bacteroidales bacterium]